jgi:hypothetical protein
VRYASAFTKAWLKRRCPNLFATLKNIAGALRVDEMEPMVFEECEGTVAFGPFAGMRYIPSSNSSPLIPKLVGTYEQELHPVLRRIAATPYDLVLDVGCAEGYYAVGLARALPGAVVRAYDVDADALVNLSRLAALNGVAARIEQAGFCTADEIQRTGGHRVLLVCDIEGGERDLLDPAKAPALAEADVLVEIHDGPGKSEIHDLLQARFAPTHRIAFIAGQPRSAADGARIRSILRASSRALAVNEARRYPGEWGFFEARTAGRQADAL